MKTRAVLFDFDGVIVKSEPMHYRTFKMVLEPLGVPVPKKRWYTDFAGTGSRYIITTLLHEAGKRYDIDELVRKRARIFQKMVLAKGLRKTPGIKQLLTTLKQKGIKTAVASGGHRENILVALRKIGLEGWFDEVLGIEDVKNRKPDPEVFLTAAKRLGMKPSECIVVEDSPNGFKAGRLAGMRVVCIETPARQALKGCITIKDFREFPLQML